MLIIWAEFHENRASGVHGGQLQQQIDTVIPTLTHKEQICTQISFLLLKLDRLQSVFANKSVYPG